MDRRIVLLSLTLSLMLLSCGKGKLNYPETKTTDASDTYYGVQVDDPYRWLEDDNSAETEAWVKAQNALTEEYLAEIPFRDKLKQRLNELTDFERMSMVDVKGEKYYYFKNIGLQEHSILYVKEGADGQEKVLLDPNTFSDDGSKSISSVKLSEDGKFMVYTISQSGSDWNKAYILDTETGELLPEVLSDIKFADFSWFEDGFYYSKFTSVDSDDKLTAKNTKSAVYLHKLNTEQSADEMIYTNSDNADLLYDTDVKGNFLCVYEKEGTYGNQLYLKNIKENSKYLFRLTTGFNYEYRVVAAIGDKIYVLTNYRAPRFRLAEIDLNTRAIGEWNDIIPEAKGTLKNVDYIAGKFIALYLDDVQHKTVVFGTEGAEEQVVELPGAGTVTSISGNREGNKLVYGFTSYIMPETIYEYNLETKETTEFFKPEITADLSCLASEVEFYKSKDGTKIPLYLVHSKEVSKNGKNPALLYGYGGFNITVMPHYSPSIILWAEMGGVYAHAHIRGGSEYGEVWHSQGTKLNKQNVFDDFISAAEYIQSEKYTSPEKTAIYGGSNGGLLIGAVSNQRPELFAAAVPAVGVMDMLRYQKFTIGWAWAGDYGTVDDDSTSFANLYGYSPLHNISSGVDYPAIMVTTADHDDRVVPAHSFKYAATLQAVTTDQSPKIIRIQTKAGHGAGKTVSVRNSETADVYAFMLKNMGEEY